MIEPMPAPSVPFKPGVGRLGADRGKPLAWAVFIADKWRVIPDERRRGRSCARWKEHADVFEPVVAELNRERWHGCRYRPAWWAYCARHLYGRWLERVDGELAVVEYRLRPVDAGADEPGFVRIA